MLPLHQILITPIDDLVSAPNPLYIMHLKLSTKPEKYWACRRNLTVIFRNYLDYFIALRCSEN